jgi:hypothetical protein
MRKEVFLGWGESHSAGLLANIGLQFWSYMGMSKTINGEKKYMTVDEAITLLKTLYNIHPLDINDLSTIGDRGTTLVP